MKDEDKIAVYERLFQQILQPFRNVPFPLIIKGMSGFNVIPMRPSENEDDRHLLDLLEKAFDECMTVMRGEGIASRRVNEVGNYSEPFVAKALRSFGMEVSVPRTKGGRAKSSGYPDLIFTDGSGNATYLEVKTFNSRNKDTTQRSFYLSPSDNFKVSMDARHLLLAFEMAEVGTLQMKNEIWRKYRPEGYTLVSLDNLYCDLKYEFNADNRRLYDTGAVLIAKTA